MLNRIIFTSRTALERMVIEEPCLVISLTDPGESPVRFTSEWCVEICRMECYDIDRPILHYTQIFTPSMARNILRAVEQHRASISLIIAQCEAGISRSAGVAAALAKLYLGDDKSYFRTAMPNMLIYRTILKAYYEKI